jgi:hypothetical protein
MAESRRTDLDEKLVVATFGNIELTKLVRLVELDAILEMLSSSLARPSTNSLRQFALRAFAGVPFP